MTETVIRILVVSVIVLTVIFAFGLALDKAFDRINLLDEQLTKAVKRIKELEARQNAIEEGHDG